MVNAILDSFGFGRKIYNRFPLKYREDDELTKFTLRRYLDAVGEGGFKYSIDDWNGIYDLVDPNHTTLDGLLLLYEQFGLPVFHGIPESYLRYFLPNISHAFAAKGSLRVLDFVLASLAGVKVDHEIYYDENIPVPSEESTLNSLNSLLTDSLYLNGEVGKDEKENFDRVYLILNLFMDQSLEGYLPDREQFIKILRHFIPFYIDFAMRLVYFFTEQGDLLGTDRYFDTVRQYFKIQGNLRGEDSLFLDTFKTVFKEQGILTQPELKYVSVSNQKDKQLNGLFILNLEETAGEYHHDTVVFKEIYEAETLYIDDVADDGVIFTPDLEDIRISAADNLSETRISGFYEETAMVNTDIISYYPMLGSENRGLNTNFVLNDSIIGNDYFEDSITYLS